MERMTFWTQFDGFDGEMSSSIGNFCFGLFWHRDQLMGLDLNGNFSLVWNGGLFRPISPDPPLVIEWQNGWEICRFDTGSNWDANIDHLVGKITFSHPLRSKILGKKGENLGKFGKICHFDTILNRLHLIWFEKLTLIEIGIFLDPFPSKSWKKGQNYRQIRYFDALLIRLHLIWFEKLTLVEIGKFLDPFRSKIMQNQAISRKICHFDTILNRLHLIWFEKLTLIEIGKFLNPFPSKSWKKMAKISENSTFWRHAHLTAFDLIRKMNLG